jgi:hypothetical protein
MSAESKTAAATNQRVLLPQYRDAFARARPKRYHRPIGDSMDSRCGVEEGQLLARSDAEDLGYEPCQTCYPGGATPDV